MNDILKTLKMIDSMESKKPLTESAVAECGDMGAMSSPAPQNTGNPVTASITLNASGMEHVADLMRLMQQAGLEKAGPPAPMALPMRADMEQLRDKMNTLEKPGMESSLEDDVRGSEIEEWDNEPEEQYQDHNHMLDDLAGGINKPKKMYKPAAKGDNPMAAESIKDRLYKALIEKKAKPDFLDVDKDGDKKEPMKKAIADKKKKAPVKEGSKPDFLDMDKDGDKKEPMKKAIADKKKKAPVKESMSLDAIGDLIDQARAAFPDREHPIHREISQLIYGVNAGGNVMNYVKNIQQMMGDKQGMESSANEAGYQAPTHELDDTARKAMNIAQTIKRKINSGEQMDDRDYNQMAELGAVLSRFGTNFGPKSMKDVMAHMVQYTDDRNEEGHGYPEFNINRFKELIAMTKATGEAMVGEISDKTRNSYVKKATKSYDDAQASGDKKTMSKRGRGLDSAYDSGIRSDKKRREANSKKGEYDYNFGYGESAVSEISPDLAKRYTKAAKMDRDFNDDDIARLSKSGQSTQDMHRRNAKRTKGINRAAKRM